MTLLSKKKKPNKNLYSNPSAQLWDLILRTAIVSSILSPNFCKTSATSTFSLNIGLVFKNRHAHLYYFSSSCSEKTPNLVYPKSSSLQAYLKLHPCHFKSSFTDEFITLVGTLVLLQLSLSSPLWSWWLISLLDQCYEIFSTDIVIHILMMEMSEARCIVMICFEALF